MQQTILNLGNTTFFLLHKYGDLKKASILNYNQKQRLSKIASLNTDFFFFKIPTSNVMELSAVYKENSGEARSHTFFWEEVYGNTFDGLYHVLLIICNRMDFPIVCVQNKYKMIKKKI